ncbi:54S ribosomal protein, mitochondrial [Puccinia graminis f. sp. tritici]|uniref:54S ribosomal protein, mitochondrial n=1 Tax=Puccinia graminis f. sp. tritici TaxID=56615 RepID=A0A5B0LT96_PUCGR|nr:54S ribosomal protein, mitochondrial [Puccinia graminis f. sp. tritici]
MSLLQLKYHGATFYHIWASASLCKIIILNNIKLAHTNELHPGKPHLADLKPGRISIYHLLLHKSTILDLNAIRHLKHHLTCDLRQLITTLGLSPSKAHYQSVLTNQSLSQQILDASH